MVAFASATWECRVIAAPSLEKGGLNGKKLSEADIERHNLAIRGYCHDDATAQNILKDCDLPNDGSVLPGAIDLNNLEDWHAFHQAVLK